MISNLVASSDTDMLWQFLLEGNFLGFVHAFYYRLIGEGFYAVIFFMVAGIIYARYQDIRIVLVVWTLMAVFFAQLAPAVVGVIFLLCMLGLAKTLYSMFKGR